MAVQRQGLTETQELSLTGSEGESLAPEPNAGTTRPQRARPPAAVHLLAGGLGGMCGSIVTAPFDVVKTRLQSDLFRPAAAVASGSAPSAAAVRVGSGGIRGLLWNFADTGFILRDVYRYEGPAALFRGLGPTLVGVVPGRSINFFMYGNGKQVLAEHLNGGQENAAVHLGAAATAGLVTATATNPIWVVKTVMQLEARPPRTSAPSPSPIRPPPFTSKPKTPTSLFSHSFRSFSSPVSALERPNPTSYATTVSIFRREGIRGFYRGLSASLLGVTEGTIQWGLYEQFKLIAKKGQPEGEEGGWRVSVAAGSAKLVATMITYPHEVIRTRLRQPITPNVPPRYTSLIQAFRRILAEESWRALYGGLSPHLLRVVPNAITMFYVYEKVLKRFEEPVVVVRGD